jgi:hypothetical protein
VFLLQVFCFKNVLIYSLLPSGVASANILVLKERKNKTAKGNIKKNSERARGRVKNEI